MRQATEVFVQTGKRLAAKDAFCILIAQFFLILRT